MRKKLLTRKSSLSRKRSRHMKHVRQNRKKESHTTRPTSQPLELPTLPTKKLTPELEQSPPTPCKSIRELRESALTESVEDNTNTLINRDLSESDRMPSEPSTLPSRPRKELELKLDNSPDRDLSLETEL